MAGNTLPLYSGTPHLSSSKFYGSNVAVGPSANTAQDGTGANAFPLFQAGTNGSIVHLVKLTAMGSPAATVCRLFWCNSTSGTFTANTTNTAATSALVREFTLPAVTLSQTAQSPDFTFQMWPLVVPASTWLFVTFGTSTGSAGTGYDVLVHAGDY